MVLKNIAGTQIKDIGKAMSVNVLKSSEIGQFFVVLLVYMFDY